MGMQDAPAHPKQTLSGGQGTASPLGCTHTPRAPPAAAAGGGGAVSRSLAWESSSEASRGLEMVLWRGRVCAPAGAGAMPRGAAATACSRQSSRELRAEARLLGLTGCRRKAM